MANKGKNLDECGQQTFCLIGQFFCVSKMPKISLEIRINLENVTNLKPENIDDFRWYLKLKCSNCGETTDRWNYVSLEERCEISGSRGSANLVEKCKLCGRQNSLDILKDSLKSYSFEKNSEWQPIVSFDCRGIEPVDFDPRVGWSVEGVESNTVFKDVNLNEREWADYDEKAQNSVGIFEWEHRFVKI